MELTLRQIIVEKQNRAKIEYTSKASWIPEKDVEVITGKYRVKVLKVHAELRGDTLRPVVICKMSENMGDLKKAKADGWQEVPGEHQPEV